MLEMRVGDRTRAGQAAGACPRHRRRPLAAGAGAAGGAGGARAGGTRPQTLGAEVGLSLAFLWRGLLRASARGDRPRRALRLDSVPPPNLAPRPGRKGPDAGSVRTVADKIAPLELAVRDDAPVRVNLLVPTIDLQHLFGGYIAKFNLARRLAERGHRVRIVTVDPVGPLPRDWRSQLESYAGLDGLLDTVEVTFGRESQGIEVNRGDRFIATTWWSAHIAAAALPARRGRLVHLPDPGVRAVHVRDGHLGGAGRGLLRPAPHRAVLQRAAARLLPQPPDRGLRATAPRPATPPRSRSRTRSRPWLRRPRPS